MHHGLERGLDPGAAADGNAGTDRDPRHSFRPRAALDALAAGTVLPDYLGAEYCRLYRLCKLGELERFEKSISPHEYDWYLLAD